MNDRITANNNAVFAWEVSVSGADWTRTVNAHTRGQAKSWYYHEVLDAYPDLPWTAIRARKAGRPRTSPDFARNARYRGWAGVQCGQRVLVGRARGVIVGHNASANFEVLFDRDSPQYAGLRLSCHPDEVERETQGQAGGSHAR